ncbi:hypothetical protein, partial [uncultured Abiotrophia sp.]|uniref:hypothetical protein n=1 Tax=uncultured Abiotrophia sp. TaxID=316094 RepID=UPI00288914C1
HQMLKTLNVCATVINFHTSNSSLVHSSIIAQLLSIKALNSLPQHYLYAKTAPLASWQAGAVHVNA